MESTTRRVFKRVHRTFSDCIIRSPDIRYISEFVNDNALDLFSSGVLSVIFRTFLYFISLFDECLLRYYDLNARLFARAREFSREGKNGDSNRSSVFSRRLRDQIVALAVCVLLRRRDRRGSCSGLPSSVGKADMWHFARS